MITFLYFTDPHVRINSPSSRLDNFYETILNKLSYVAELGHAYNVDAFICGGDLIDRPDIPYSTLTGLVETLAKFKRPIYTVLGNHDIYGYNPDTHHRTAVSVIRASGLVTRLGGKPIIIEKGPVKVSLTGCDAHYLLDKDGRTSDYTDIPESDATKIHVVHGFLTKKRWEQVPSTEIDDIIDTKADIVLTGHEHSGFGVIRKNDKIFCNPGALARVTASVGDINLEVKVALIEVDESGFDVNLIKLPSNIVRPANEVLDRDKLEQEKQHKQVLANLSDSTKQMISDFSFDNGLNIFDMLSRMSKEHNLPKEVEDFIRNELQEAEEELNGASK